MFYSIIFQVQITDRKVYAFLSVTTGAGEMLVNIEFSQTQPLISIKDLTVPACPHTCAGNAVQHASSSQTYTLKSLSQILVWSTPNYTYFNCPFHLMKEHFVSVLNFPGC